MAAGGESPGFSVGVVYRTTSHGSGFQVLHALRKVGDGRIFGITRPGGTSGAGTLISFTVAESRIATLAPVFNFDSLGLKPIVIRE